MATTPDQTFDKIIFKRLAPVPVGASWLGLRFRWESDGTDFDSALATVTAEWFDGDNVAGPSMATTGGSPQIVINDAAAWDVTFSVQTPSPFEIGIWRAVVTTTNQLGIISKLLTLEQESFDPANP